MLSAKKYNFLRLISTILAYCCHLLVSSRITSANLTKTVRPLVDILETGVSLIEKFNNLNTVDQIGPSGGPALCFTLYS